MSMFKAWREFQIGGAHHHLIALLSDGFWADTLTLADLGLVLDASVGASRTIKTIILTPQDLGHPPELVRVHDVLNPLRLQAWNTQHRSALPHGHVVDLLPPCAAPYVRVQYVDQPDNERLWVGAAPIAIVNTDKSALFSVQQLGNLQVFDSHRISRSELWCADTRIVFWLRPKEPA